MPAVLTSKTLWPGPGSGSGRSTTSMTSGPPKRVICTARTSLRLWLGASRVPGGPHILREAMTSRPHRPPGLLFNDAMTPAETVLAFQQAAELRDGSAFTFIAEDFIQHAAGPQGRDGFRQTA